MNHMNHIKVASKLTCGRFRCYPSYKGAHVSGVQEEELRRDGYTIEYPPDDESHYYNAENNTTSTWYLS